MFELTKDTLKKTLEIIKMDDTISSSDIDGLLIKKMAMSNILKKNRPAGDTGKQTHIAFTSKERSLFPMVSSVTYYDKSEDIKFYDLKLPVTIIKSNIEPLDITNCIKFESELKETFTICYIRKDGEKFQVQLSKLKNDDKDFIDFRGLISEEDYLCIIKKKNEFKFYFLILKKDFREIFLEEFNTNENLLYLDKFALTEVSKDYILEVSEPKEFFISNDNILILAIYLSKFSEKAYKYMGFKNWTETYLNIAKKSKSYNKPNSINNLRDQFDPKFDNGRAGWHQTELSPKYQNVYELYKDYNEEEFRSIFNEIWYNTVNILGINDTNEDYESLKKINKPHNRIVYGAPGTGKSFKLNEEAKILFCALEKKLETEELEDFENVNYWVVGANYGNVDKTDEFFMNKCWENGYDDKYQDKVNLIREGDLIGIKSSFTRKIDNTKFISVLRIKALGIVTKNHMNGKKIDVNWVNTEIKDYDEISYRTTIHEVQDRHLKIFDSIKKKLVKTETIIQKINPINRVTFYDGYTHGQFVGTYKPVPEGDSITYKYIPGPFMKQLVESYKNPKHNFCLIIEEINRAKADKVFGNIFHLLDRDSDGNSEYHIAVSADQETYLKKELGDEYNDTLEKLLNKGLYIPNNLYIWATMNSADQGVYPIDSAFKRRWHFEHIGLDQNEDEFGETEKSYELTYQQESETEKTENKTIVWNDFRKIINENLLRDNVSEDRLLAPFFIKENNFQMKEEIYELDGEVFKNKILMYLFDDVLRHKKKTILFDENIKSFSQLIEACKDGKVIFSKEIIEKLGKKKIIKEEKVKTVSEEG